MNNRNKSMNIQSEFLSPVFFSFSSQPLCPETLLHYFRRTKVKLNFCVTRYYLENVVQVGILFL